MSNNFKCRVLPGGISRWRSGTNFIGVLRCVMGGGDSWKRNTKGCHTLFYLFLSIFFDLFPCSVISLLLAFLPSFIFILSVDLFCLFISFWYFSIFFLVLFYLYCWLSFLLSFSFFLSIFFCLFIYFCRSFWSFSIFFLILLYLYRWLSFLLSFSFVCLSIMSFFFWHFFLLLADGLTQKNLRQHNGIYNVYCYEHDSGSYNYYLGYSSPNRRYTFS